MPPAESTLLERARAGDEAAFLALYREHRTRIFRFARRLAGSAQAAEDITQDCFVALLSAWLADQLSGQSGRPVVDETGLAGEYDFTVSWVPNPNAPNAESLPDIFAAVRHQLGLKLEPNKGVIEVLIVDHAEKTPSGN